MKRTVLFVMFSLIVSISNAQEWFTSFDVAKRLAIVQDKMLFALWEGSFDQPIHMLVNIDEKKVFIDLSKNTSLDPLIWDYFIPVRIPESEYSRFMKDAKGRGVRYIEKLNDDSIKIMDVNGNILNTHDSSAEVPNLYGFINRYALNTSYLTNELRNYMNDKTFVTSSLLANKYVDFAIYTNDKLRPELIELANIYLDDSVKLLKKMEEDNKEGYFQRLDLIQIKGLLILNQSKSAYIQLKKIDEDELDEINKRLFSFLNYTALRLLGDEINADLWKSKISSLDLKKAELIISNNLDGDSN